MQGRARCGAVAGGDGSALRRANISCLLQTCWRGIFVSVSAISLLLCLLCAAFWLCSARNSVGCSFYRNADEYRLQCVGGRFSLMADHNDARQYYLPANQKFLWSCIPVSETEIQASRKMFESRKLSFEGVALPLGYWWGSFPRDSFDYSEKPSRVVVGPIWPLLLFTSGFPLTWTHFFLRRRRSRSRRTRGLCRSCGFDLRASTERCPECGVSLEQTEQSAVTTPAKQSGTMNSEVEPAATRVLNSDA